MIEKQNHVVYINVAYIKTAKAILNYMQSFSSKLLDHVDKRSQVLLTNFLKRPLFSLNTITVVVAIKPPDESPWQG